MPKIPEETIDRVREATDIVDVVGRYVQLRQRGRNYFGLCPFHQEDTPSFSVAPDKQIYHCFGCGKGGNVFSFLMEYERITFPEAVKRLAEGSGISLPEISSDKSTGTQSAGPLYEANAFAMRFFEKALYSDQGEKALAYLRSRDFSDDTLKAFRVGLAPDAWDSLVTWGPKNNHDLKVLHRAGLISQRKDGSGFYDRFRNRIMFPIINVAGRVVAFGGRAMDPEDPAKYMNSPESPVYQKRKILYGLNQASDAIRRDQEVFIVEGYTDLMRLWEHEFTNAVAVSG
ncbi:MAG TPA: DNA primase, partial [bacterium]|nr:DNA primase [bacterium]